MVKRNAQSELNADNWDQEEVADQPTGAAQVASAAVLQRRTIIKAKRKTGGASGSGGGGKLFNFGKASNGSSDKKPTFSFGGSSGSTSIKSVPFSGLGSGALATSSKPSFGFGASSKAPELNTPATDEQMQGATNGAVKCDDQEKDEKFQLAIQKLNSKFVKSVTDFVKSKPCVDLKPCFDSYNKHFLKIVESYATESVIETLQLNGCRDLTSISPVKAKESSSVVKKAKPEVPPPVVDAKKDVDKPAPKPFNFASSTTTPQPKAFSFTPPKTDTFSTAAPSNPAPFKFGASTTTTAAPKTSGFNFTFGGGAGSAAGASTSTSIKPEPAAVAAPAQPVKEGEPSDSVPGFQEKKFEEKGVQYEVRCKLYYKADTGYSERGVGTLFIKKDDDGKGSILVRAENASGTILLNSALSKNMPVNDSGKNNVLLVCVVNPPIPKQDDLTGKTNPFLVKVKNSDQRGALIAAIKEFV